MRLIWTQEKPQTPIPGIPSHSGCGPTDTYIGDFFGEPKEHLDLDGCRLARITFWPKYNEIDGRIAREPAPSRQSVWLVEVAEGVYSPLCVRNDTADVTAGFLAQPRAYPYQIDPPSTDKEKAENLARLFAARIDNNVAIKIGSEDSSIVTFEVGRSRELSGYGLQISPGGFEKSLRLEVPQTAMEAFKTNNSTGGMDEEPGLELKALLKDFEAGDAIRGMIMRSIELESPWRLSAAPGNSDTTLAHMGGLIAPGRENDGYVVEDFTKYAEVNIWRANLRRVLGKLGHSTESRLDVINRCIEDQMRGQQMINTCRPTP